MFYVMDNVVPWREAAWTVLSERLHQISGRCASLASTDPVIAAAARQVIAVADTIDATRLRSSEADRMPVPPGS
jgi:hypothetical protein